MNKKIIIFILIFGILSSSLVSAGFWDFITGRVASEPSVIGILNEGEIKTYTTNGIDYEVALDYVNPTSAKFSINGEITSLIPVDGSYKLVDGAVISVNTITYQDFAGGIKKAEFTFFVEEEKVKCTDSDGGEDYYKKGHVVMGSDYENDDSCTIGAEPEPKPVRVYECNSADCFVNELSCDSPDANYVHGSFFHCPYGCKDGACIRPDIGTDKPNPPIDLSNYPYMLIKDGKLNAVLVIGDKAPAEDVIAASDIAVSIQFAIEKQPITDVIRIDVGTTKLASQIADPLKLNIISVGSPCINPVSAQLMGNPADCTKGFTKDKGLIKLYNYNGYAQIVVAGYSDQDTRKTANVLSNWKDYNLYGNEMCVYGTRYEQVVKPCGPIVTIRETVKCVFKGSTETQECYSADPHELSCKGIYSCTTDVVGKKGDEITWKSSCGGYAYTTTDGKNEYAEFDCETSEISLPFIAAVDDRGPSSDVVIISDVLVTLKGKGYEIPVGTSKLFSEVNALRLDNKVTLAVYLGEAIIIVGEHSPASHVKLAIDIKEILSESRGITSQTILSSEVPSADLLDLFEEESDDEEIEIPEEEIQEPVTPPTPIEVERDECKTNKDCDDNDACTSDLCSGTPKRCSHLETSFGCDYNGNCIPIGVRVSNNYCDIDRTIKPQLGSNENCNNNYECSSNICVNNNCVSQNFIQKIMDWFKKLFGG